MIAHKKPNPRFLVLFALCVGLLFYLPPGTEGGTPNKSRKIVTFAIEKTWNNTMPYGSGGYCSSGGMNHAKYLLSSFLAIASVLPNREPVILRPSVTFSRNHGEIPDSVRWSDMFDWSVDSDEFRRPEDVWKARQTNPSRFEVLSVFMNPGKLITAMRESAAEVLVMHM